MTFTNENAHLLLNQDLVFGDRVDIALPYGNGTHSGQVEYDGPDRGLFVGGGMPTVLRHFNIVGNVKREWFDELIGYTSHSYTAFPSVRAGDYHNLTRLVISLYERAGAITPSATKPEASMSATTTTDGTTTFQDHDFVSTEGNEALVNYLNTYAQGKGLTTVNAPTGVFSIHYTAGRTQLENLQGELQPTSRYRRLTVQQFLEACDNYEVWATTPAPTVPEHVGASDECVADTDGPFTSEVGSGDPTMDSFHAQGVPDFTESTSRRIQLAHDGYAEVDKAGDVVFMRRPFGMSITGDEILRVAALITATRAAK